MQIIYIRASNKRWKTSEVWLFDYKYRKTHLLPVTSPSAGFIQKRLALVASDQIMLYEKVKKQRWSLHPSHSTSHCVIALKNDHTRVWLVPCMTGKQEQTGRLYQQAKSLQDSDRTHKEQVQKKKNLYLTFSFLQCRCSFMKHQIQSKLWLPNAL